MQRVATLTVMVSGLTPVGVTVTQGGLVGIADLMKGSIRIVPNPATGLFRIVSGIAGRIEQINILDLTGRVILSRNCSNDKDYEFDLSDSPQGCYFLKIKMNGETLVLRLVISR